MESSIRGVPLSAVQLGPSDKTFSGIRAPLTVDESDFEGSVSSKSRRNSTGSSYYSGSEVEDYESGEDVLETARAVEEEEGIVEKTDLVKEFSISEGDVVELNGERVEGSTSNEPKFVQEIGSGGGNAVFRPFARIPSGRTYKVVGNFDDSDDSGSMLSDSGDDELVEGGKYVANYSSSRPVVAVVDEEEVSEKEVTPVMSMRVSSARKLSIPVAKITGDSDDDSRGSEVLDDEGFSGIARVPSIAVLQRIDSAPKVRMWEADEGDENESQAEDVVEMEFVGNLVTSGTDFRSLDEKEPIVAENSLVQDNGPDFNEETIGNSLTMIDEYNPMSASGQNGDAVHLDEEIKEVDVIEDRKENLESVDHREPDDGAVSLVLPNTSGVASVAESNKLTEPDVSELGSSINFGTASLDNVDAKSSSTGSEDNRIFNHDNESENVERLKQEIDQIVESFSSNTAHEISSLHQCVDIKEVPAEGCSELSDGLFIDASSTYAISGDQSVFEGSELDQETGKEAETSDLFPGEVEQLSFHSDDKAVIAEMDMVQDSTTQTGGVLLDHLKEIDGLIVEEFDKEVDVDGGMNNQSHIIDPALQAETFKAVRSAVLDDDAVKFVSDDGIDNFSLGSNLDDQGIFDSARSPSGVNSSSTNGELNDALGEREEEKIKKIQKIRVKYLRLLDRLGCSPEDSVASKVLYQLVLAAGSSYSKAFHLETIKNTAMELESQTKDELDFPLSVLIIGKTGVGKSATINSIFGESSAAVDAFEPASTRVKEFVGLIDGVKLKVFDTPGLRTSLIDQSINRKILSSIKKRMKKSPPDVILYVDRLDTQRGDLNDLPLLRLVNSCLGSSIWRKCVVAFTHGTSVPPDGPNGYPLSYEAFVAKQSQIIERLISHSAGEQLVNSGSRIPVCVIENHPFAEKNEHGENWRFQLLHLCCSMKILSEVSSVVTNQSYMELFGLQTRSPPLSYFLSSLLQSNVQLELSNDHSGSIVRSDVELCSSDFDQEEDIEHENLPLFKPLDSSGIARLTREQREAYFDEYDYHVWLVQKKESREEMRRTRSLSRSRNKASNETYTEGVVDQETEAPESEAPLADMGLSLSFDGDDTSFKYHVLEPSSRILTGPVHKYHGWDHDCNYDGLLIEDKINIADCFPAMISVQLTKDKKVFNMKLHSSVDIRTLREKLAYILNGKTKIKNFRKNKTTAGVSIAFVEENVVLGFKVEDSVAIGKRTTLVGNAGVVQSQDDAAFGVNFDLCRRDKDHVRNEDETSLRISVMKYKGDLIYGCNLHSHISISRNSKLDITAALNNMLKGKISIKTSSSDQLQIAALALVPIAIAAIKKFFGHSTEECST